jgi:hypothetical protein
MYTYLGIIEQESKQKQLELVINKMSGERNLTTINDDAMQEICQIAFIKKTMIIQNCKNSIQ